VFAGAGSRIRGFETAEMAHGVFCYMLQGYFSTLYLDFFHPITSESTRLPDLPLWIKKMIKF
jgi:hypothetical protein